jgi:hypothetical protein
MNICPHCGKILSPDAEPAPHEALDVNLRALRIRFFPLMLFLVKAAVAAIPACILLGMIYLGLAMLDAYVLGSVFFFGR